MFNQLLCEPSLVLLAIKTCITVDEAELVELLSLSVGSEQRFSDISSLLLRLVPTAKWWARISATHSEYAIEHISKEVSRVTQISA